MESRKRLYLLDGTAMAYRAYFAFVKRPLLTSTGENTSAPFGFTSALLKIIREEKPDYIAAVFDSDKPTFRHEKLPSYKATRQKMPEEMVPQLPRIHRIVEALDLPYLRIDGYEADDVIGTLAVQGVRAGLDVVLVTGDKDLMQLVGEHVTMLAPGKLRDAWDRVTRDEVVEKWGVEPAQIRDLLGLMGDSSDNIPGVPTIGPKTAAQLIGEYGSLDGVLAATDRIEREVIRRKLVENADIARLSRELATIVTDVPVALDLARFAWTGPNFELLRPLFRELEFFQFLEELDAAPARVDLRYETVTPETLPALSARIRSVGRFAVDTETSGTDPYRADLVGISLSCDDATGYYIPIGHLVPGREGELNLYGPQTPPENVPIELVREHLGPLLADPGLLKIAQNFKFDLAVLERAGFTVADPLFDTMVASYLLDPAGRHGLDAMAQQHLDHRMIPITDLIGTGRNQTSFAYVPVDRATEYSGEDAAITWQLAGLFERRLEDAGLVELMRGMEMPLERVLLRMERIGIRIDAGILRALSAELTRKMDELVQEIYRIAGEPFNINSTQQLAHVLFDVIGLKSSRKTKTGHSTDMDVLESLAPLHPLPRIVLDYRHLAKLVSTYIDALPRLVDPDTSRVHTSFNQTVASTGRLSSTEPNLQNIPIRGELGARIREAFVPEPGWKLISADYSQIELRVMAHVSGDVRLIEAFRRDEDIHTLTAALVFNLDPKLVTPDLRRQAKTINFGVIYGQTPYGLGQQLGISQREAAIFIDNYFATYPGVKTYSETTIEKARRDGYVTTLLGRRRYVPEISAKDVSRRHFGERIAINMPIQGTAADMIKLAMIRIDERLQRDGYAAHMLLQVHDELLFEAPPHEVERLVEMVRSEMCRALELSVPVKVEVGVGDNWLETH